MPGTHERYPASSGDDRAVRQPLVDEVPVGLRVAVFGAALAAELTRVVARFGAAVFGAAALGAAAFGARAFGAAVFGAAAFGAAAFGAAAFEAVLFGAAVFGAAVFAGASATASTTLPGVRDEERTFDQVRSPRSARLP